MAEVIAMTTHAFSLQGDALARQAGQLPDDEEDWPQLCASLIQRFASVPTQTVVVEVARAKHSVSLFGLSPQDELEMGRRIAWNSLMILTGEVPDAARLDPESHLGRRQAAPLE
jgi:hypothetical protein